MTRIEVIFKKAGATSEDKVKVEISYDIIRHVSAQLYTNPRKAIEELICNSYDAGATICHVALPKDNDGFLAVLDNGKSMNLNGLKDLWKVAYSPKVKDGTEPRVDNERMQIGKFGVGKLAAFSLGGRLTYITCVQNKVRVISVGQDQIKEKGKGKAPSFDVYLMDLNKAMPPLAPYFYDLPKPWEEGWDTWTLALVEEISEKNVIGNALKIGFLRRMITNALPISANFKVFLEKTLVPLKEIKPEEIEVQVDVTNPELRKKIKDALQCYWQEQLKEEKPEDVPQKYYELKVEPVPNPQKVSEIINALIVPELGPVMGNAIITKTSLTTEKLAERGYSQNGFAIYVNGRQINPEDDLWGISPRSLGYWTRFLARVEIPGLDRVLLVQRNAVSENTKEAQIAREVMRTLFNFTRVEDEKFEKEEGYKPESFGSRLRILSPLNAPLALSGLAGGALPEKGIDSLEIDYSSLGEAGPAARYDPEEKKILVNEDHPLIRALDDIRPNSKALRHVIGEVLAGAQMAKGYLRSQSIPPTIVEETGDIIEVVMRSAASFVRDEIEEHIKEIDEASYVGGTVFENAVISAFRSLRLAATHYGEPDMPDGIIEIPISGKPNLRISS